MRQNFKLFCCAAYILNLIVSICLSCWPNLWYSGVFSAEFRKNSANPDISRKYGSASRIFYVYVQVARGTCCKSAVRTTCLSLDIIIIIIIFFNDNLSNATHYSNKNRVQM